MAKKRILISVDAETDQRIRQYVYEHHTTISQCFIDWVWAQKVTNEQIRGQEHLNL